MMETKQTHQKHQHLPQMCWKITKIRLRKTKITQSLQLASAANLTEVDSTIVLRDGSIAALSKSTNTIKVIHFFLDFSHKTHE